MPHRALIFALTLFVSIAAAGETMWPTRGWKASSPEEQAVDASILEELDRELSQGKHGYVDSMLVIRNGYVVYEKSYSNDYVRLFEGRDQTRGPYNYYDPHWHPYYEGGSLHTMQSVSKSVTATLVGIAIREGRISGVDVEILPYFEGLRTQSADPRWKTMTLRDLLTMTSGIEWDESTVSYTDPKNSCARMEASENWVQFVLDQPMAEEPGKVFVYNSGVTELLAHILLRATGKDPNDYAAEQLFAPLGIERWYWKRTPTGLSDTEGGLYLEPRDLAKIGYLYLQDGVWEGKRILPEGWVRDSTSGHVDASGARAERRYGYQWWLLPYEGRTRSWASAGLGYGGQFVFVVPEYSLVAVFTGWNIYEGPSFPAGLALERVVESVKERPRSEDDVLYVWAFDTDQKSSDFLAVIDLDSAQLIATVPVGLVGGAHHTEHRMPAGSVFFANSFAAGTTFRFDVSEPRAPRIEGSFEGRGPYTFPHAFERLPNGNVLATFHHRGDGSHLPGGLVELDPKGGYVRGADAADPEVDPDIRPYSLAILPELDRVVSTTADMHGELLARSVQLWRLSDLSLSRTLLLPRGERGDENLMPAEPRVLADGRSVIVSTFSCGLYLLTELASESPAVTHLKTFPYEPPHRCALPVRLGPYWVQTVPTAEALVSLDVRDPRHPKLVQELKLGPDFRPHWIAADSDGERIVATGRGAMEQRVLVVRFDPPSGRMELERSISFDRETWPHGETGKATPHGALFSR